MCSVSVVFIRTMEDDQRLNNTLVYEGDATLSLQHCKKPVNCCIVLGTWTIKNYLVTEWCAIVHVTMDP